MTARVLTDDYAVHLARVGAVFDALVAQSPGDPVARRAAWTAELTGPLPAHGAGADEVVAQLADVVVPNGVRLVEPGFWGWITSGATTVPTIAALAASFSGGQRYGVTSYNLLEGLSLRWLAELCGLDPAMQGVYSSGGSTANLVALGAARQHAFERNGIDVAHDGLGSRRSAVYASAETHHTIQRSAGVLGIGRGNVRLVETDSRQRMRPGLLRAAIERDLADGVLPVAVVANAGTTNTGAIDPIREVGEIAREHGIWFHVDGAYGLPGILDESVSRLYDGVELADSAIVDPHKWLNVPVGVAATFVRDADLLYRAFTQEPAAYLQTVQSAEQDDVEYSLDSMGVQYSEFGVELSSPSRGVVVWSTLRELGRDGVAARVSGDIALARRLAEHVRREPRLELLTEPTLSIVCFRFVAEGIDDLDAFNEALLKRLQRETPYLPSDTRVGGVYAIRPCFINARTTPDMVDGFAAAAVRLGDELLARPAPDPREVPPTVGLGRP